MIALVSIIALHLEPVGTITEEPWDFLTPVEIIDIRPLEDLERDLKRRNLRILQTQPED